MNDIEQDALRRIRGAVRHGWSCALRTHHVQAIDARLDAWISKGVSDDAAARIARAARHTRGVRLSRDECRTIVTHVGTVSCSSS